MDGIREMLLARRAETVERIAQLSADVRSIVEAADTSNIDDEHDPEGTTIAFERAQAGELLRRARVRISELDAALAREAAGSYGRCEVCGRPIGAARLAARPTAVACIDCA